MRLVACTDQHHRMTTANVAGTGAPDYNFCLAHERIEIMIGAILSSSSSSALLTGPDTELRVLTLVIALGARIALYKTAIVNVQKAAFLGPVVGESQKMGVSAATAMCDVLLQADVLNADQVTPSSTVQPLQRLPPLLVACQSANTNISLSGPRIQSYEPLHHATACPRGRDPTLRVEERGTGDRTD